jgi:hypothetical protein
VTAQLQKYRVGSERTASNQRGLKRASTSPRPCWVGTRANVIAGLRLLSASWDRDTGVSAKAKPLAIKQGEHVVHVGTGTGYYTVSGVLDPHFDATRLVA